MIAAGPRSPTPGAPFTYVTPKGFLEHFGLETLRDLPDIEALEDAGLLGTAGGATEHGMFLDTLIEPEDGFEEGHFET